MSKFSFKLLCVYAYITKSTINFIYKLYICVKTYLSICKPYC